MSTPNNERVIDEDDVPSASAFEHWSKAYEGRKPYIPYTRKAWSDEVEAICYHLADAKARLNTFSPVCLLPDEVLAYIFKLLVPLYPILKKHGWGWIGVTHVTQCFRAVALAYPALWSTIPASDSLLSTLFFTRSRNALLTVKGNPLWNIDIGENQTSHQILSVFERVRVLDIDRIHFPTFAWLESVFRHDAPELQMLALQVHARYHPTIPGEPSVFPSEWPSLDHQFLAQRAPKLMTLSLDGMRMPWCIQSPLPLRSLILDLSAEEWQGDNYTTSDVIRCLQNTPSPQGLVLWGAIPNVDDTNIKPRARLSYLRLLFLADESHRSLSLWSSLDIPPSCSVRVDIDKPESEDVNLLCTLLKDHFSKPHLPLYDLAQFGDPDVHQPVDGFFRISLHCTGNSIDKANIAC